MKRKSRIMSAGIAMAAAALLASCDHKTADRREFEKLEDRITELEDANRLLRDQLEEAKSSARNVDAGYAVLEPAESDAPDHLQHRPSGTHAPPPANAGSADADVDRAIATARAAAAVAEDARNAAKAD